MCAFQLISCIQSVTRYIDRLSLHPWLILTQTKIMEWSSIPGWFYIGFREWPMVCIIFLTLHSHFVFIMVISGAHNRKTPRGARASFLPRPPIPSLHDNGLSTYGFSEAGGVMRKLFRWDFPPVDPRFVEKNEWSEAHLSKLNLGLPNYTFAKPSGAIAKWDTRHVT